MMIRTIVFVLFAYGTSWALWFAGAPLVEGMGRIALATVYMFGPLVGALVAAAIFDRGRRAEVIGWRWRVSIWWLVAWVAAPILAISATYLSALAPGVELQSIEAGARKAIIAAGQTPPENLAETLPTLPVLVALAMLGGIIPNAIAAFGEEAGWRGYLWTSVRGLGFWKASLIVGTFWGLWHAPLIISGHNYGTGYAGFPWSGVAMMTAFCIALSPFMGLLRDRTGSSLPAAIFHGTVNAISGVTVFLVAGADIWTMGIIGIPGLAVLAVLSAAVALMRPNAAAR